MGCAIPASELHKTCIALTAIGCDQVRLTFTHANGHRGCGVKASAVGMRAQIFYKDDAKCKEPLCSKSSSTMAFGCSNEEKSVSLKTLPLFAKGSLFANTVVMSSARGAETPIVL